MKSKKLVVPRYNETTKELEVYLKGKWTPVSQFITLDSLLKDNCKMAINIWGEPIITSCEKDCKNHDGLNPNNIGHAHGGCLYHLHKLLDFLIYGGSIQEYIDKTKIC